MQQITRNDYITAIVNTFTSRAAHFEMPLCDGGVLTCEVGYLALLNRRQLIKNIHYGREFLPAKAVIDAGSVARGLQISAYYLLFRLDQLQGTPARLPFPKRYLLTTDSLGLTPKSTRALADAGIFFLGDVATASATRLQAALPRKQYNSLPDRMRDKGLALGASNGWPGDLPEAFLPLPHIWSGRHPLHELPIARTELRPHLIARLELEGFRTLGDLMTSRWCDLYTRSNVGKVAMCRIETLLAGYGLRAFRSAYAPSEVSLNDPSYHLLMLPLVGGMPDKF